MREMEFINREILASVLAEMRKTYPDAIIAGGACRDILLGRKSKDIDVFTALPIDPDLLMHPKSADEYEASGGRICGVTNPFDLPCSPIPVQVVWVVPPDETKTESCVDQFCFGINQTWFSGGAIEVTSNFQKDAEEKQVTVTYCFSAFEAARLMKKHNNLLDRYEWPLMIPINGTTEMFFAEAEAFDCPQPTVTLPTNEST
jgi:hypothetical protein